MNSTLTTFIARFSSASPNPMHINPAFLSAMAKCKIRTNNATPSDVDSFHLCGALDTGLYTQEFVDAALARLSKGTPFSDPSGDATLCHYLATWWSEALEIAESIPALTGKPLGELMTGDGSMLSLLDANRELFFHALFRQNNFGVYKAMLVESSNPSPIGIIPLLYAKSLPPLPNEITGAIAEVVGKQNGEPLTAGAQEVIDSALGPIRSVLAYMDSI